MVGNVNLASNQLVTKIMELSQGLGINKVLLLPKEHRNPSFLFQNLSSYNINNQYAKFQEVTLAARTQKFLANQFL